MSGSRILVVDDSRMFLQVLVERLTQEAAVEVVSATTLGAVRQILEEDTSFDAALLDLNLPDAPAGEVVDVVLERKIPVIVFAGDCTESTRQRLWAKPIVDYIVKEGEESLRYAVGLVRRVLRNRGTTVLVVDDSATVRHMLSEMLAIHCLTPVEATSGSEALHVLAEHPEVRLMITDYDMPEMDGVRLVRAARALYPKDQLAIIGISGHDQKNPSARFLKSGANDFLHKPFSAEELYCRITQNLDLLDYIHTIWDMSHRDALTGLANRRWFFQRGQEMLRQAAEHGTPIWVAMLDLDHFKRINDSYGHEIGDAVLRHVTQQLQSHFGAGLVGRLGGEEFAVVLETTRQDVWDECRQAIASQPVPTSVGPVDVGVSLGVCRLPGANLERHLACADALLYRAKHRGRNRVEIGSEPCPQKQ